MAERKDSLREGVLTMTFNEKGEFEYPGSCDESNQPYPERVDTPPTGGENELKIVLAQEKPEESESERKRRRTRLALKSAVEEAIPGSTIHYASEGQDGVIYVQSSRQRNSETPDRVTTQMTIDKQTIERHIRKLYGEENSEKRLI